MSGDGPRPMVVLVGSFDTKGEPLNFLSAALKERGCTVHHVDFGIAHHASAAESPPTLLAKLAGKSMAEIREEGRAGALDAMGTGVGRRLAALHAAGSLDAVVYAGGSGAGTVFGLSAAEMPFGVPKVLVSTIVAGDTRGYLRGLDALLFYPVVDIEGDNEVLRSVLRRAADATAGLAHGHAEPDAGAAPSRTRVALTMFGITTPAVTATRRLLEKEGHEVTAFHANGTGGAAMEKFISEGRFDAVIDLTTTELADLVGGGTLSAGQARLTAAAAAGIPQVVVPGALDAINFGGPATVPGPMRTRRLHRHNENVTLVRTTPDENTALGALIAQRVNRSPASTTVVVPMGGFSELDAPGMPFWWPAADKAFHDALRGDIAPSVRCVVSPLHVNDPEFSALVVSELAALGVSA